MAENNKAAEEKPATAKAAEDKPAKAKAPAKAAAAKAEKPAKAASAKAEATAKADKPKADKPKAEKPKTDKAKADKPATSEAAAKPARAASTAKAAPEASSAGGTLKVHHLRPAPGAKTAKTRVGRGEGSKGKTAGRGTKGTKARYQVPARFEGGQMPLHMRLPKLRGFKNPFRVEYQVVNLDTLTALYPKGGAVTAADLVDRGAVRKGAPVKVLGAGEIDVKLDLTVQAVSASAKAKIEAAGGSVALD